LILHVLYKFSLALAYDNGDLARAYPLARGMVPQFAAVLSYVTFDQLPSDRQFAGIAVVSTGVLIMAFRGGSLRLKRELLFGAASAGAMVACYSIVDAYGIRLAGWASFTVWLIVFDCIVFLGVSRLYSGEILWSQIMEARVPTLIAGVLGGCSFVVFLWALSSNPPAVVVAFRECSVLFSAMIGMIFLRERVSRLRIVAVAAIAGGLLLVALQ
jgi:uncharacterized membrane protein